MSIFHILFTAINAVMPVVLMILLGYFLRQIGFVSGEFVKIGNKLVFKVCLPCMLLINVYDIESFSSINWSFVIFCVAMAVVTFVLGYAVSILTTKVPERRGVIWQCTFRSNFAIIGLSLAAAVGGDEAVAVAAIVSAFVVPLFNVMAVIALTAFVGDGDSGNAKGRDIVRNIVKNPIIIGVALGLACMVIREIQMAVFGEVVFSLKVHGKFLYTTLNNLKTITSPLALLMLGGQFEFSAVRGLMKEIVTGTVFRILVAPLLGIGGAILLTGMGLLSCGANEYPALIAMFGSPVAVTSAVMAGSMGGDEQLATQLVVWTSLFSIFTVFAQVCILMSMGLLAV